MSSRSRMCGVGAILVGQGTSTAMGAGGCREITGNRQSSRPDRLAGQPAGGVVRVAPRNRVRPPAMKLMVLG